MNSTSSDDPTTPESTPTPADNQHLDPITGEPGAHPVGVGIGAAGAGIAGATIGLVAGPVGALIGAAIGAVAGGLAGKEVAEADDEPVTPAASGDPAPGGLEGAEAVLPAAGMAGLYAGGVPAATMAGFPGMTVPGVEREVAGSSTADEPEAAAGQFHDAFTATTFREAEAQERIGDEAGTANGLEDSIRTAAYFRYLDRQTTGQPGDHFEDWIETEREVLKG